MPSNQRFRVREKLRRILQTVGATEKLFTTRQIFTYLGQYIEKNKLHDSKNMHIVRCKGDFLEELFGVQEFTIESFKDMWQFVFPHIIPATNREVQELETQCQSEEKGTSGVVESAPRKMDLQWMSQLPWWYFVDKDSKAIENPDIATASGSIVATSTVYVVDTDYEVDSIPSNRTRTDPFDEDRFSLEYEPDSEEDSDSDDTEPVDSSEEPPFTLPSLPRFEYSEDTTTTDTTDVSMDCDIPLEDHWSCKECRTSNPPTVGYCQRCWKLRKGWLDSSLSGLGLPKSQTLPAGEYSESFTPPLLHTSSQPNPLERGIDVADGKSNETYDDHRSGGDGGSNFKELPFNNAPVKRKLDSSEELSDSQIKKKSPKGSVDASTSQVLSTSCAKSFPNPPTLRSSTDTASAGPELHSSSSSTMQHPQYSFSLPGLCNICHNNPNDATIVHGNFGHQYCCCKCAKKLKRKGKNCPVCRQPIEFVVKNFIYQM